MACLLCGSQEAMNLPKTDLTTKISCQTCGQYAVTDFVIGMKLLDSIRDKKYLLSALARQESDAGRPLTLTKDNFVSLLESLPSIPSPLENINRTLLLIMKRQTRADELVDPKIDSDYPLVYAHDANEFRYFLEALRDQGLLKMPEVATGRSLGGVMLTPSGWQQALELQKNQRNSDQAFMAMWFAEELNEAWENGFKPALQEVGFHPYRADQDEHNDKIDDRIVSEIRRSGLLVADFTGHRGGVYFEAGFAFGLGIPVIWTCRESDIATAHFDTRQYNHVVWSTPEEIKSKLILRINATARIIRSG